MKVQSINSISSYNQIKFRANNNIKPEVSNDNASDSKNRENKPLPEWARKSMLAALVFFAVKNDPAVQNYLYPYEPTQEELDKTEFVHDYGKLIKDKGVSSAFYHLSQLTDIEQPKVKALGKNAYSLEFDLDKQKVIMEMTLDKNNKDTIRGRVKLGERNFVNYAAVFPNDNKDEFKILIKDKNKKYVFGRDYFGDLYQIHDGKKVQLNKKNVQRYEEYQEELKLLEKFKFFTNENDFWRKANLVLLIFLIFNEMVHDHVKRKQKMRDEIIKKLDKMLEEIDKLENDSHKDDKIDDDSKDV